MKLNFTFATLLVTIVGLLGESEAAPARNQPRTVTFPVRSLHGTHPDGVHPSVVLQQHINRSHRRWARMTGREPPSDHELRDRLEKRMHNIPAASQASPTRGAKVQKRFDSDDTMLEAWRESQKPKGGSIRKRYDSANQMLEAWRENQEVAPVKETLQKRYDSANGMLEAWRENQAPELNRGKPQKRYNSANAMLEAWRENQEVEPAKGTLQKRYDSANGMLEAWRETQEAELPTGKGTPQKRYNSANAMLQEWRENQDQLINGHAGRVERRRHRRPIPRIGTVNNALDVNNAAGVDPKVIQAALSGGVTNANPPTGNHSLGLNIEAADTGYLAEVQIGTPPKTYQLLMDSGSADLWVGSDQNCQSQAGGGCGNHQFLGFGTSSSFQISQQPFQVTYGSGEVSGLIAKDNLNVAGLQLTGHIFGVATLESVDFSSNSVPFDGLMGLASSKLSQQRTLTPVEALKKAGLIDKAITSYKISRIGDGKNDGEITFGGTDQTKFDANTAVTIPNVSQQGFWEANLDAVTVDGKDLGLQGRTAILDTGTTLLVVPPEDALTIHKAIDGAQPDGKGGFIVPCTLNQTVALTFGGKSFDINPHDIALLPVDVNDPTGNCISGISAGNVGGANEWLTGDVFLKNAYFSTNVDDNTVLLAKLV